MQITMEGRGEPRARSQCDSQDPGAGRKGNPHLRQAKRPLGQQPRHSKDRDGHCRQGQESDQTTETTSVMTLDPGEELTVKRPHPCFFILLKNVLRGMPSSLAATLLLPPASFERIDEPLPLVGDELGIPIFAGRRLAAARSTRLAGAAAAGAEALAGVGRSPTAAADRADAAAIRGRSRLRPGWRSSSGRSSSVTLGPSASTTARSIVFSSSRMFPGQS